MNDELFEIYLVNKNKLDYSQNLKNKIVSEAFSIELRDRLCQKPWCDQAEPKALHYFHLVLT